MGSSTSTSAGETDSGSSAQPTGSEGGTVGETGTASTSTGTSGASTPGSGDSGGSSGSGSVGEGTSTGAVDSTGAVIVDADGDGLDDGFEAEVAADYLPFLSLDPADKCPMGGMLYRVSPHPKHPEYLFIVYDHLYERDCGLGGHVGDDEVFGVTVDPGQPAPAGILAIKAIGHQNTLCEKVTECGKCPNQTPCPMVTVMGEKWPLVYSSKDKHASYVDISKCVLLDICTDTCTLAAMSTAVTMLNAGEPGGHLTENLTTNGFITVENGWTEMTLFNYNPWEPGKDFGSAGSVAGDLVDMAFVPSCP